MHALLARQRALKLSESSSSFYSRVVDAMTRAVGKSINDGTSPTGRKLLTLRVSSLPIHGWCSQAAAGHFFNTQRDIQHNIILY